MLLKMLFVFVLVLCISCGGGSSSPGISADSDVVSSGSISCKNNNDCKADSNGMCDTAVTKRCLYWDSTVSTQITLVDSSLICSSKAKIKTPWRLPAPYELELLCNYDEITKKCTNSPTVTVAGVSKKLSDISGDFFSTTGSTGDMVSMKNANFTKITTANQTGNVLCIYGAI